jgi:F-type H+-transporting ATPase subunit delta
VQEKVLGYADAVLEQAGADVARVADELEAFSRLLEQADQLRAVLGGAAVPAAARRGIVRDLLGGKVCEPTLALACFAVQSGPGANYTADIAALGLAAAAKRDGVPRLDDGPLGRVAAAERLDGYATAVLAGAGQDRLGEVEDELFRFMRTVEGNEALFRALTASELPVSVREKVVSDLLRGRATPESARLASYAARVGRPRDYLVLLAGLVERVAREAARRVADVRSATELTPAQHQRLVAAISRYVGSAVEARVTVEPGLLGGFVAQVGDTVLDASLRQRLRQASELLCLPSTQQPGGTGARQVND